VPPIVAFVFAIVVTLASIAFPVLGFLASALAFVSFATLQHETEGREPAGAADA
jgi:hypothetical protein